MHLDLELPVKSRTNFPPFPPRSLGAAGKDWTARSHNRTVNYCGGIISRCGGVSRESGGTA